MKCLNCGTEMMEYYSDIIDAKEIHVKMKFSKYRCYKCNSKAECTFNNNVLSNSSWHR